MTITRKDLKVLVLLVVCFSGGATVHGDQIYAPDILWDRNIADKTDPVEIADTHLGIPYRDDGALDSGGHFTTFSNPDRLLDTPGLNCSGLVVSVARFLLNKNFSLAEVTRDRLGNSGDNAPLGKDWDFGWDLILNLTEGRQRRLLSPDGRDHPLEAVDGVNTRGFDLHDTAAWRGLLSQMRPGKVYLGSISRPTNKRGYKVLHYHVVMMIPDTKGGVWLYHSTQRSNVHRMNIATAQGMNRFQSQFRGAREDAKDILVVEATLPDLTGGPETSADAGATTSGPPEKSGAEVAQQAVPTSPPAPAGPGETGAPSAESQGLGSATQSDEAAAAATTPRKSSGPEVVINHLAGKVFKAFPELVTHIPRFADEERQGVRFSFQNWGRAPRQVQIYLKTPGGTWERKSTLPADGSEFSIVYPKDFAEAAGSQLREGEYQADVLVDGIEWCADLFEVARQREAQPKILNVKVPTAVQSGKTFSVVVEAQNRGAESDYGGITVSSPDPSGLKLVSSKSGRIHPAGSTLLSVTSDRIRSKVAMSERWIELWGQDKTYDMEVQIQAGRPGTYPLYVRCALRGVNVKSSVILMDPASSEAVDQQGFPVYVYQITVR